MTHYSFFCKVSNKSYYINFELLLLFPPFVGMHNAVIWGSPGIRWIGSFNSKRGHLNLLDGLALEKQGQTIN